MSEKILVIHREPFPKERPRGTIIAGHVNIYTPKKTVAEEKAIAEAWKKEHGLLPYEGPVSVRIVLGMAVPKSTSMKKKKDMLGRKIRPTVKPDADNCAKLILDALNGLAYQDDNQIVDLSVRKYYTEVPKILIKVSEWKMKENPDE